MKSYEYFGNMSIEMSLHGKCVICGMDEHFHIDDNNENGQIFKDNNISFCRECAIKFARKILQGIDF